MTFFVLRGVRELGSAASETPLPQPGAEALVPVLLCFLGALNPLLRTKELESRSGTAEAGFTVACLLPTTAWLRLQDGNNPIPGGEERRERDQTARSVGQDLPRTAAGLARERARACVGTNTHEKAAANLFPSPGKAGQW